MKTMRKVFAISEQCTWYGTDPLYVTYHDTEWGVPCYDGRALWEQLVLEGFQAGLSWITILRKREGFRNAFAGFDPSEVSTWDDGEVTRLLTDARIIRHRGKIEATITNAQAYLRIEQDVGFSKFIWDYVDGTPIQNRFRLVFEGSFADAVVCTNFERPQETGFSILRADNGLRIYASLGSGE